MRKALAILVVAIVLLSGCGVTATTGGAWIVYGGKRHVAWQWREQNGCVQIYDTVDRSWGDKWCGTYRIEFWD